ncbi:restriction endonuclease subunit S [Xanthomonas campestris]|uniref:restriction endonuclease subunit S n=1 Tax=Xanthomonas campestris TaxID=339 RepID=UPI002B2279A3|nr:restriction endonuclease subunit S [Xanthomonas campestris]MEA9795899.1 restriction endonuclease subunit S [Xanthomonas campestris pv. raphani]MEA9920982.1 restriction endonuclease subunit S [Xanthomonas campestris pv. raphani]MEC5196676.1 type I restriction enzyme S subunit [Xanthomonas campestris]
MSDTPNIDIRPDHWQIVRDILRRHVPQYEVWAFGSRAKWLAKQYSDLDLAIITDQPLSLAISAALADDFSESDLPWKVDVVDWATTGEPFRRIIEKDRVIVQENMRGLDILDEWTVATVGDVFDLVNGYAFKSTEFIEQGVPVIKIKNVKPGEFSEHDFSYVSDNFLRSRSDKVAQFGDLLISMSGNRHDGSPETWVGKVAQFRKAGNYFINQRVGALRAKPGAKIDGRFASYVLSSISYQELFIAIATSSGGQANLSPRQIFSAPLRYPALSKQRAIAHILGTLDDKIELSRRMNQTLEAMARALFKSWFVDFDGMPPEGMQESDLGLIPQGWRVGRLDELLILQRGFDLPAQIRVAGQFPVVAAGGINGMHHKAMVKGPGIITGRSGVLGNVFFELSDFWPLNTTLWVKEFRVAKPCYAYELLSGLNFKKFNSGSAVPTLNRNHIHQLPQIIPPSEVIKKFEEEAMSLRKRIVSSERESRTLARLRDTLLPKLLSGELRVKDAERMAETI